VADHAQASGNAKARGRAGLALVIFLLGVGFIYWLQPADLYLWLKAVHVIAVISWMAGMLYLPRLFINHIPAARDSELDMTLRGMEQRLMRIIMTPAMLISWVLGLWLGWAGGYFAEPWFIIKLLGVFGMTAAHGWFAGSIKKFANGTNSLTARQWRIANEVPTLLLILIIIMVIVKPF
jgi:protoporphyrinogen IX oxidase